MSRQDANAAFALTSFLYGGNANMKGLPEYLGRATGVPVHRAAIWDVIGLSKNAPPPIPAEQALRFATVAGLALRAQNPF